MKKAIAYIYYLYEFSIKCTLLFLVFATAMIFFVWTLFWQPLLWLHLFESIFLSIPISVVLTTISSICVGLWALELIWTVLSRYYLYLGFKKFEYVEQQQVHYLPPATIQLPAAEELLG